VGQALTLSQSAHSFGEQQLQRSQRAGEYWIGIDYYNWIPHLAATNEILIRAQSFGAKASYVTVAPLFTRGFGETLPSFLQNSCGKFPSARFERSARIKRASCGIEDLEASSFAYDDSELTQTIIRLTSEAENAQSKSDLKRVSFNGEAIGYPILSTLESSYSRRNIDFQFLKNRFIACLPLYFSVMNWTEGLVNAEAPTALVVFNGRFTISHAICTKAKQLGVDVLSHDAAGPKDFFVSWKNIHSPRAFKEEVEKCWKESDPDIQMRHSEWFESRIVSQESGTNVFAKRWDPWKPSEDTDQQNRGKLKVTFFPTSEHEFVSISPEWDFPGGESQLSNIKRLIDEIDPRKYEVTVRLHPNLSSLPKKRWSYWLDLASKDLKIILPDSSINSYNLVASSSVVVTCGSTVGLEAAYLGVPSVSVGPCLGQDFSIPQKVVSFQEVLVEMRLMGDFKSEVLDLSLRKIGLYLFSRQIPFQNVPFSFESPVWGFAELLAGRVWRSVRKFS